MVHCFAAQEVREVSNVSGSFRGSLTRPDVDITFTKGDLRDVVPHDNDPIVISLITARRTIHRVLVDQGSSADVMFWPTF